MSTLRKINRNFRFSQNKVALDALRAQVVAELAAQQPEAAPSGTTPRTSRRSSGADALLHAVRRKAELGTLLTGWPLVYRSFYR
jgi:hypothetical protein